MFPFWEKVVAPVLEAAEVKRLVEVGALRGENTRQILDTVGPEAELHVIDPVPDFDPEEHAKQFGGQYIFHRDLSINVLGELPLMDAALLDGDHNWFTVYNECRLLAEVSAQHDAPLPVMVFHDVCWPYGRRDLYYNPDNVPAEFRQEWQYKGMRPGEARVLPVGGLNPTMANAVMEGGPRNGVMTGIEDFVAEYPKPLRLVVLPIYFGLAIVVEEERLVAQPALARFLDHLDSTEGKDMLLELAESMRLDAMLFQHRIYFQNEEVVETLARRYLDSVKRGLTDEYYRDTDAEAALGDRAYAPGGRLRLDYLHQVLDGVRGDHVLGDLVSVGRTPAAAILARAFLQAHRTFKPEVWLALTGAAVEPTRRVFERFDLLDDRVHVVDGGAGALSDAPSRIALLHIGAGQGAGVEQVLTGLHARLAPDAAVIVDDAADPAVRGGIDAYRRAHGVTTAETTLGQRGATWRNSGVPATA